MTTKDPFRPAERHTRCPGCKTLLAWNREDGLAGQQCVECSHIFTGRERPTHAGGQPWLDDQIQLPRLLAELRAAGLTEAQYSFLRKSMDVSNDDIDELLARADIAWNGARTRFARA